MSEYLPIEIVQQVLLRLPIKPLLQCTSICKTWYNLITSPDFISAHLSFTNSLQTSTRFLMKYHTPKEDYVISSDDTDDSSEDYPSWVESDFVLYCDVDDDKGGTIEEYARLHVDIDKDFLILVGSCNGIICLSTNNVMHTAELSEVFLWNPVIGRTLRLPKSDYCVEKYKSPLTFGFVFDHIGNDYKVLRIRSGYGEEVPSMVEVFRLSTGLWEYISCEALFGLIYKISLQVNLKGVAHWIWVDHYEKSKIVSFDVHEEVFGSIGLPVDVMNDDVDYVDNGDKFLFVFEESLFLIRHFYVYDEDKWKFDIWRMGEYNVDESWNKLHTWVFDESVKPVKPHGFRKNGEILWAAERTFISTNIKDASHTYLGNCQNDRCDSQYLYFAESLIPPDSLSIGADGQKLEILQESQCL